MDDKELDKMAKDLDTIDEPQQTSPTTPVSDGFVEDKETYVKPDGETTDNPKPSRQAIKEDSAKGKWVLGGLATILVLALGAGSAWLYTDAQKARNELNSTKTGLEAARADAAKLRDQVAKKPIAQPVTGEDFDSFNKEYNKMLEASVELTDADKAAIAQSIKDYYKITTLPEKWQIILGYKDAKADKQTGKPANALVLWPASDQKPAGFFEVTQDKNGKWAYNEHKDQQ